MFTTDRRPVCLPALTNIVVASRRPSATGYVKYARCTPIQRRTPVFEAVQIADPRCRHRARPAPWPVHQPGARTPELTALCEQLPHHMVARGSMTSTGADTQEKRGIGLGHLCFLHHVNNSTLSYRGGRGIPKLIGFQRGHRPAYVRRGPPSRHSLGTPRDAGGYWIGETPCNFALSSSRRAASADHPTRAKSRNSNAADWAHSLLRPRIILLNAGLRPYPSTGSAAECRCWRSRGIEVLGRGILQPARSPHVVAR